MSRDVRPTAIGRLTDQHGFLKGSQGARRGKKITLKMHSDADSLETLGLAGPEASM